MRTVRIMLTLALTLLFATTVMAQGAGGRGQRVAGKGGIIGWSWGPDRGPDIARIVDKLQLSDDEKAAVAKVRDKFGKRIKEAREAAAPTQEQQEAIKMARQEAREKNISREEMTKFIQGKVKRTDKQLAAYKELQALQKEQMTALRAALSDANKAKLDELLKARRPGEFPKDPGGPTRKGGGKNAK